MNSSTEDDIYDQYGSTDSSDQSWITWFCNLPGHDYYIEVPQNYIKDPFNMTGLSSIVPYYYQAMETILDIEHEESTESEEEETEEEEEEEAKEIEFDCLGQEETSFWNEDDLTPKKLRLRDPDQIETYATMLYGLIHQRYILTQDGLRIMGQRYSLKHFGTCPRYYCKDTAVIPKGNYSEVNREGVHLYCPRCLDIYIPDDPLYKYIDGAHFGPTYCHLLFLNFPEFTQHSKSRIYEPSIFGFKINSRSESGPRNQWLRKKPITNEDYTSEEEEEEDNDETILSNKDSYVDTLTNRIATL